MYINFLCYLINADSFLPHKTPNIHPPHTPVFQNKTVFFDISFLLPAIPAINPIRTAHIIFVINVKIGNPLLTGIRLMAYLDIAPAAPPRATNKNSIYFTFF
jgi:hypothetical protein